MYLDRSNVSSLAPKDEHLQSWTASVHSRGTWNLVLSCLSTTFLCTWVVLHPKIDDRKKHRILHKLALSLKTFIAPELIAVEAAQEWTQARRIVRQCREKTDGQLKMIHALYVGMFGIRYRVHCTQRTKGKWTTYHFHTKILWPTQLVFLINNGHLIWKNHRAWGLDEVVIGDKSNADATAKLLAIIGAGRFTVEVILRLARSLPVSPLEAMTIGYIPLFILTYFFWWGKPKDIHTPTIVDLPVLSEDEQAEFDSLALSDAFDDEDKPHQTSLMGIWRLIPRDFEIDLLRNGLQDQPQRFGQGTVISNWDPDLYHSWLRLIACAFGASFGALHFVAWKNTFPTIEEEWIWRVAAMLSMAGILLFMQFERVVLCWTDPISWISLITAGLYLFSRGAALTEAFISLRAVSPAIYAT